MYPPGLGRAYFAFSGWWPTGRMRDPRCPDTGSGSGSSTSFCAKSETICLFADTATSSALYMLAPLYSARKVVTAVTSCRLVLKKGFYMYGAEIGPFVGF